jgi:hypothetical protein
MLSAQVVCASSGRSKPPADVESQGNNDAVRVRAMRQAEWRVSTRPFTCMMGCTRLVLMGGKFCARLPQLSRPVIWR